MAEQILSSSLVDLRLTDRKYLEDLAKTHNELLGLQAPRVDSVETSLASTSAMERKTHVCEFINGPGCPNQKKFGSFLQRKGSSGSAKTQRSGATVVKSSDKRQLDSGSKDTNAAKKRRASGGPQPRQSEFDRALSAFLGRCLVTPNFGPDAPPLELKKLFSAVALERGGSRNVDLSDGWCDVAKQLGLREEAKPQLRQTYLFYLRPLEDEVGSGERLPDCIRQCWAAVHRRAEADCERAPVAETVAALARAALSRPPLRGRAPAAALGVLRAAAHGGEVAAADEALMAMTRCFRRPVIWPEDDGGSGTKGGSGKGRRKSKGSGFTAPKAGAALALSCRLAIRGPRGASQPPLRIDSE
uniref:ARID domain-containing protein n=1 Tax=Tetraselmis sp. GSL018 TaxID=582737 RepID=A0A061R100_9CHLO|mmetsp:Transcript_33420/g.79246  ORF Transcript_33420/g.79246 Transcript_33420/m.79246 type:complete len:358 (+) Transcript_33420:97-1170(+)|eukprot:CAMPEP_0177608180 /NCGR_PEP_ID=MMETSP0419_2-20121207/18326_1 /TAXON_ID=582737 /ORGANISM="Tetraselmis sp., Strain GSL018" /LENGTH=357 /DNA_ID=CAMNT_0019102837 /DNA_START=85 /DNA_END=1158 /DNA_ORIENTATION=+